MAQTVSNPITQPAEGSTHAPRPPRSGAAAVPHADYDAFVSASPQGSIYCRPWWLEAVAPGQWQILTVTKGEHLLAAWPIVLRQAGRRADVVMPAMTQKLGVLLPPPQKDRKYAEQLTRELNLTEQLLEELPADGAFEHCFHENFTNHLPFHWRQYRQTTRYTYVLEDLSDVDEIWAGLRPRRRKAIRNAGKAGLEIVHDIPLETFLDLNDLTFRRQGLKTPVSRDLLRRIDAACLAHAGRKIVAARDAEQRIHAAVYIVYHDGVAYYLMLGSDPELRDSNAASLAMWHAIRFASTVARRFDFEGSMMRNVEPFIRDFGARLTPYFAISKPPPPTIPARAVRKVRYIAAKVKARLSREG